MNKWLKYFIPNFITFLHCSCGFIALYFISINDPATVCLFILLSVFFDSIDGYTSRVLQSQTHFGAWFDSFSDFISFGIATPLLVFNTSAYQYGGIGFLWLVFYSTAVLFRLIRFTSNQHGKELPVYQGLPCPIGGCYFAILILFFQPVLSSTSTLINFSMTIPMLVFPILMISNFTIKKTIWHIDSFMLYNEAQISNEVNNEYN